MSLKIQFFQDTLSKSKRKIVTKVNIQYCRPPILNLFVEWFLTVFVLVLPSELRLGHTFATFMPGAVCVIYQYEPNIDAYICASMTTYQYISILYMYFVFV